MDAIRIVLGTMPQMLRDILREVLGGQPDIQIVSEARSDQELSVAVAREAPDVVVLESTMGALGPVGARVLRDRPTTNVLTLSADGRAAAMYQLRASKAVVREVSPTGLRQAIRGAQTVGLAWTSLTRL